jgi:hypothetical protein
MKSPKIAQRLFTLKWNNQHINTYTTHALGSGETTQTGFESAILGPAGEDVTTETASIEK